jgi:hypothetical protein
MTYLLDILLSGHKSKGHLVGKTRATHNLHNAQQQHKDHNIIMFAAATLRHLTLPHTTGTNDIVTNLQLILDLGWSTPAPLASPQDPQPSQVFQTRTPCTAAIKMNQAPSQLA